jgi:hypothetical protein
MSESPELPATAQAAEKPDLFRHLAQANVELGHAVLELLSQLQAAEARLQAATTLRCTPSFETPPGPGPQPPFDP